jgi:WD40 repeat protein
LASWCRRGARDLFVTNQNRAEVGLYRVAEGTRESWLDRMPQATFPAASPDGRWVAAGSFDGGEGVRIWEADSGKLRKKLLIGDADAAFSPDGRWLYTATSRIAPQGPEIRAWRVASWEADRGLPLDRTTSSSAGLAASPDGRAVAAAVSQNAVRQLDAASFAEIGTLAAPETGLITYIRFSPDSSKLVFAASHLVHLWDLRRLRRELAAVALDWDAPSYSDAPTSFRRPLRVELDRGGPGSSSVQRPPGDGPSSRTTRAALPTPPR